MVSTNNISNDIFLFLDRESLEQAGFWCLIVRGMRGSNVQLDNLTKKLLFKNTLMFANILILILTKQNALSNYVRLGNTDIQHCFGLQT